MIHALIRVPLVGLTYLVTQQTTNPVENLSAKLDKVGLCILSVRESLLGSFIELVARKPEGGPA